MSNPFRDNSRQNQYILNQLKHCNKQQYSSKKELQKMAMNKKIMKYYKILNLRQDCSDLDIRKAYRSIALKIHPDKSLDRQTHEQFHALNKIYNRLLTFRKNKKDMYISFEENSKPIPMGFANISGSFVQFQQNFQKHIQTLDNILDSLKSMNRPTLYPPVNNVKVRS